MRLLIIPLTLLALLGCDVEMQGASGNLSLAYTHGGLFESTAQPIGAGLTAEAVVRNASSDTEAALTRAASNDDAVLTVTSFTGATIDLLGVAPGTTDLAVETAQVSDSFALEVAAIDRVRFGDPIYDTAQPSYAIAAGSTLLVERTPLDATNRTLTGYGLAAPTIAPEGSATFIADDPIGYTRATFATAGTTALSYGEGEAKNYTVIDPAGVTFTLARIDNAGDPILLEESAWLELSGTTADGVHVLANPVPVDPTVCTVESLLGAAETYVVTPIAAGTCTLHVLGDTALPSVTFAIAGP